MNKECILEDKLCTNCGKCNYCDLDESKICDNCCQCFGDAHYRGIIIDDILFNIEEIPRKNK